MFTVELEDVGVGLLSKVDAVAHRSLALFRFVSLVLVLSAKFCFSVFILALSSTMLTFLALIIKSPMNDCKGEMGVLEAGVAPVVGDTAPALFFFIFWSTNC